MHHLSRKLNANKACYSVVSLFMSVMPLFFVHGSKKTHKILLESGTHTLLSPYYFKSQEFGHMLRSNNLTLIFVTSAQALSI